MKKKNLGKFKYTPFIIKIICSININYKNTIFFLILIIFLILNKSRGRIKMKLVNFVNYFVHVIELPSLHSYVTAFQSNICIYGTHCLSDYIDQLL